MERKFKEGHDNVGEVGPFYDEVPVLEESSVETDEDLLHHLRLPIHEDNDTTVPCSEGTETTNNAPESNEEKDDNNSMAPIATSSEDMKK